VCECGECAGQTLNLSNVWTHAEGANFHFLLYQFLGRYKSRNLIYTMANKLSICTNSEGILFMWICLFRCYVCVCKVCRNVFYYIWDFHSDFNRIRRGEKIGARLIFLLFCFNLKLLEPYSCLFRYKLK